MADKKITDLPALTSADADDYIPIVDSSANITKKLAASGLTATVMAGLPATTTAPFDLKLGPMRISAGIVNATVGGSNITFPTAFASAPIVVATVMDVNNQSAELYEPPTATGAKIKQTYSGGTLSVHWVAFGKA